MILSCRGEKHTDSTLAGEYAQTKLFNIMTAFELDHRFSAEGIDAVACQPGEWLRPVLQTLTFGRHIS